MKWAAGSLCGSCRSAGWFAGRVFPLFLGFGFIGFFVFISHPMIDFQHKNLFFIISESFLSVFHHVGFYHIPFFELKKMILRNKHQSKKNKTKQLGGIWVSLSGWILYSSSKSFWFFHKKECKEIKPTPSLNNHPPILRFLKFFRKLKSFGARQKTFLGLKMISSRTCCHLLKIFEFNCINFQTTLPVKSCWLQLLLSC